MGEVGGGREEKPGDSRTETIDEVAARLATEAYYGSPAKRSLGSEAIMRGLERPYSNATTIAAPVVPH